MEICVERRAPFEPIGSFTTCTRIGWPSASILSIGRFLLSPPLSFMSATWRNPARSRPISTNADCMPGSTRATRPTYTLPTRPRLAARSIRSSCTTPAEVTATRVSRGVTLIRMSSTQLVEELAGLVQRQPHHSRVAAAQLDHEARGAPLDRVGAGLVVALAARYVLRDLVARQRLERHFRCRQRELELVVVLERHRGQHLMALARQRAEHLLGLLAIGGLAEDAALEGHRGV